MSQPGKAVRVRCSQLSCRAEYFTKTPEADGGRCHKCAAYWRGSRSALAKKVQEERSKLKAANRQRRRRREATVDDINTYEERMRDRARPLDEFLRGNE